MKVLVRTDASLSVGSGHLVRCLTLADQLRSQGAIVAFACRDLPGAMIELLMSCGYQCARLSSGEDISEQAFLDARETIEATRSLFPDGVDWLVVDHYLLEAKWERLLRPHVHKLLVIDDLADRPHDCDLLLDQNYKSAQRYQNFVKEDCRLLLGPDYALLKPEYAEYRGMNRPCSEIVQRVLVFFGGTDEPDMTGLALEALTSPELSHLEVDIVIGANYQHREALSKQSTMRSRTVIHRPRPHLADLMHQADIAIGAGGVTNWERMCLGLPSVVIAIADNQIPISRQLDAEGAIRFLGTSASVTIEVLQRALVDEIGGHRYLQRARIGMKKCDGLGTTRVIDALRASD